MLYIYRLIYIIYSLKGICFLLNENIENIQIFAASNLIHISTGIEHTVQKCECISFVFMYYFLILQYFCVKKRKDQGL